MSCQPYIKTSEQCTGVCFCAKNCTLEFGSVLSFVILVVQNERCLICGSDGKSEGKQGWK